MSYHPILVRHIMHLTDARYFAAVGVDYMSMELDETQLTFDRWHAIREWVEGPKFAAELRSKDEEIFSRIIIDLKPDAVIINQNDSIPHIHGLVNFIVYHELPAIITGENQYLIISIPPEQALQVLAVMENSTDIFIETEWTIPLLRSALQMGYQGGFSFKTEKEIDTGVKDFTEMDDKIQCIRSFL